MPSNKKNNKKGNSNWSGLITLIAWALFLTVVINYMASYSMRNTGQRTAKAEIGYSSFIDMVKNDEVASVSFTDELINIKPVDGYIYIDSTGQEYTGNITLYTSILNSSNLFPLLDEHDVDYTKPYVAKMSPVLSALISVAPFLLILLLTFFMFRGMGGQGGMGGMIGY